MVEYIPRCSGEFLVFLGMFWGVQIPPYRSLDVYRVYAKQDNHLLGLRLPKSWTHWLVGHDQNIGAEEYLCR